MFGKLVLSFIAFSSLAAQASEKHFCTKYAQSSLLSMYQTVKLDKAQLAQSVKRTCLYVNLEANYQSNPILYRLQNAFAQGVFAASGGAAAAFSDMNGSSTQIDFMSSIQKIKQNPNRMERIQAVYNLVSQYQGDYDHKLNGQLAFQDGKVLLEYTPENLVDSAKKHGASGVCRHFASLLYWSLMQVARHPSSQGMALAETDFSASFILGQAANPKGRYVGHAWVEVHLPERTSEGLRFQSFTLDSTWNAGRITFLPLRRQGVVDVEQRRQEQLDCQQLTRCLE